MCLFVPVMVLKDHYITDNLHSKNINLPKSYTVFADWLPAREYLFLLAVRFVFHVATECGGQRTCRNCAVFFF